MLPASRPPYPGTATIELDQLNGPGAILLTLITGGDGLEEPMRSFVCLTDASGLQELPEVLRTIGLALVFDDDHDAHRAVWKLLRDLAESP